MEIEVESGNISNSAGKRSENGKSKDESDLKEGIITEEKWLSEQIPPKTTFKWKKEDISKRNSDEVPFIYLFIYLLILFNVGNYKLQSKIYKYK